MIRIFLIVFVYGGGLFLFAWWVDKIFATWIQHEERKPKILRAPANRADRPADPRDGVRGNQANTGKLDTNTGNVDNGSWR